jgi:exodeoxyribonuclease-3
MKIISLNANGLRSAVSKGLADWLIAQEADVICLQEIRIQDHQIPAAITQLTNYHQHYFPAVKKGYSGVAILSKHPALTVDKGLGWPCADLEGRYLAIDIGPVTIASCYLPSGSSGPERQAHKFEFMDNFSPVLAKIQRSGQAHILCGDWNIAHTKLDIKNWQSNQKNSGFLPEERQWLSDILEQHALVDAYRHLYPDQIEYSWWSNRANAYANNVGWRIDYQLISQSLAPSLQSLSMPRQPKFSDHAPLIGEYALSI